MLAQTAEAFVTINTHRCTGCALGSFCLPMGLQTGELQRLDDIMRVGRLMRSNETLFRVSDPVRAIYAVRSGCYKSTAIDCDGNEQIIRFHLPGELLGLDGVYSGFHHWSATALTPARVCIFPYEPLMGLAVDTARLMERLLKLFSKDVIDNMAVLGDYSAEERTAAFLRSLSLRLAPRGAPSNRFELPMKKAEIANYLRLAQATLSRTLNVLQQDNLIDLDGRRVTVLNPDGLAELARRIPCPNM